MRCDECSAKTPSPKRVREEKRTPLTYELAIKYYCDLCYDSLRL